MDIVTILKQVDLFRGLSDEQLARVGQIAEEKIFQTGDTICKQGDRADTMYIICAGQVEVIVHSSNGHSESVVYLGMGQVVGEMTLVDAGRRSATVLAIEDESQVYSIPHHNFTSLCETDTDIGYIMMRNIAQHMSFKLRHLDLEDSQGGTS
jgi:CRP/FNR family transcriptional regulator, cyclic AMP receptor protein